ncbi:heat shock protein transcriptional repressor HspR [Arcanobacterium hippocoleae]|uniref:MerR family transcriptional regulator/heat shock protein HspR n=1 Tax=Arcanobacterium hippocoleae TaxID=149017 RepID=A0ABU1T362_9ACTO|nr:MerR family transcriptional regulator [Arcanobacterium hippocoleae]MDR6939686.1 MerR family transcriptional regulator/heat shock protein HspR [Arcanobacterium hippocoleae]
MAKVSRSAPILTVSVAAELARMHPQTVRQYDRLGLVVAQRTRGGGRRYSLNDVDKLLQIQALSQEEGINLAGIARIVELENEVEKLRLRNAKLQRKIEKMQLVGEFMRSELERFTSREHRVFAASATGDVTVAQRFHQLRAALHEADLREEALAAESAGGMVLWNPRNITIFQR